MNARIICLVALPFAYSPIGRGAGSRTRKLLVRSFWWSDLEKFRARPSWGCCFLDALPDSNRQSSVYQTDALPIGPSACEHFRIGRPLRAGLRSRTSQLLVGTDECQCMIGECKYRRVALFGRELSPTGPTRLNLISHFFSCQSGWGLWSRTRQLLVDMLRMPPERGE